MEDPMRVGTEPKSCRFTMRLHREPTRIGYAADTMRVRHHDLSVRQVPEAEIYTSMM